MASVKNRMNGSLARIFYDMAAIYRYLGTNERFRALAYGKAARTIEGLKEDLSEYLKRNALDEIPGIGESIASKISEFAQTGRIKKYEELKRKVPLELMDLLGVSGFGPESLRQIHNELGVETVDELVTALQDGSVSGLKGFGPGKVRNMMRGLKLHKQSEERMLLWKALALSEQVLEELKKTPGILRAEIAGSVRRKKETIGDIDILIACKSKDRKKIVSAFVSLPMEKSVLAQGETKASILITGENRQVDLRLVNIEEWGAALLYFTGSKEHNVHLRTIAKERGLKMNEYGVFRVRDNKRMAGETEEEIYKLLGFEYVPPEMREDKGELALAAKNKIPRLIEPRDIRGDMQMHSTWSDGNMDIHSLAKFVMSNYHYDYIVLTDHSKSERIAGGMTEKEFLKQFREIDAVNRKLGKQFVRKGVEVDILPDGTLDLGDELLSQMDWVCASIHSGFSHDNTGRLVSACRNAHVHCIGHPSGRLIGKREAYPVNWKEVIREAGKTGTALEINAQPDRMDLNDTLARQAREAGVSLTISTDSHSAENYEFMKLGVYVARRAWCTPADVLNTKSWKEIEEFKKSKLKITKTR